MAMAACTVYSLTSAGAFNVLVTFTGANGAHGNVTPVLIGNTLYGATDTGGANNDGVVFSVNTDGTGFTVLHSFGGADGAKPQALVVGPSNTVYGITESGGLSNVGVLFSITQAGTFSKLHDFSLPVSSNPNTLVASPNGMLLGSTFHGGDPSGCHRGCGTIFAFNIAAGTYSTVNKIPPSGVEGDDPYVGSVGPGPTIYGAESAAIFGLNQQSGFVPLASLNSATVGSGPQSGPLYTAGGTLYGVLLGSISATNGLIYSLKNGFITDLFVFDGTFSGRDGADPIAQPILTPTGRLIGTTSQSGDCNTCGTVWEYTP